MYNLGPIVMDFIEKIKKRKCKRPRRGVYKSYQNIYGHVFVDRLIEARRGMGCWGGSVQVCVTKGLWRHCVHTIKTNPPLKGLCHDMILKILLVTRFKDRKAAILTLKMRTGSRLWFCKNIPEAACDKLIFAHFPWSQWEVGTREHRPTTENAILRRVSVRIFQISKYFQLPELQLPGYSIQLLSRTQISAMAGQWWFPSHHVKYKCFMPAACVDSSLQLSISAETIHPGSHFKLLSEYKTWIPILHLSMARYQSGSLL